MKRIEYTTVEDKSVWGDGPWVGEPDKIQWVDEATGLPCMIKRNTEVTGSWCGYVGVSVGHPAYEKHYDGVSVDVHGGLTYAAKCWECPDGMAEDEFEAHAVCHLVEAGEDDDVWWLGFDCGHGQDISPLMEQRLRHLHDENPSLGPYREGSHGLSYWDSTYKDTGYVIAECEDLARQLKEIA